MSLITGLVSRWAKLPAPVHAKLRVERDLAVPMADGVTLLADRWAPVDQLDAPIVLVRTPYGRRTFELFTKVIAAHGYQVVSVSCRGTFGSGGAWEPFFHEADDGRATLAWLERQPWFVPAVHTWGPSYLGLTQWAVAADPPHWLRAQAIGVSSSFFRELVYTNGRFSLDLAMSWINGLEHQEADLITQRRAMIAAERRMAEASDVLPVEVADRALTGHPVPYFTDWLAHEPPSEDYWSGIDFSAAIPTMAPVTMVAGWYDIFLHQQLADFTALRAAGRPARITIGPWVHASVGGMLRQVSDGLEFFDAVRAGRVEELAPLQLYVMGSHTWRSLDRWPPEPAEVRTYHLAAGGALRRDAAAGGRSGFTYDPRDPTPATGGRALNAKHAGPRAQDERESRADVLCFTTEPLKRPTTVIGVPTLRLTVTTTAVSGDLFVRLCDVSGARSINLCDGSVPIDAGSRAEDGSVAVETEVETVVEIELGPIAHTFLKHHRIRLQVSAGAHPLMIRNLGLGEPVATARTPTSNRFEITHADSALSLPLVP